MGKDCRSPLQQQCSLLELPNTNFTSSVPYPGQQMLSQPFANSYAYMNGPHLKRPQENGERHEKDIQQSPKGYTWRTYANGSLPGSAVPELPHSKTFQRMEELERYFYVPYLCESETPVPDSVLKEKLYSPNIFGIQANSNFVSGSVQKPFFVFDHSDKTANLSFTSLVPSPAQNSNLADAPIGTWNSEQKESRATRDLIAHPCPTTYEGLDENKKTSEESEMHEDTEELDALLYSDSGECEEEEEISTAHSPGEALGPFKNQGEIEDEVTSPVCGSSKRKRLCDEDKDLLNEEGDVLRDTASSVNASKCEDDTESSSLNGRTYKKLCSSEASNRLKRERIWDTMSILQSIVPGVKGGDSALILDEAIKYLSFLKLKAKSLGVAMD